MNLFHLQCFQVVAQENHMTRAAQRLNIAQPALSNIIAKLEKDLDTPLFDRVGRQIILNRAGQVLLEHVNVMLEHWDTACSVLERYKREAKNQVELAITGLLFPQRLVLNFKLDRPDILIKQSIAMSDQIEVILHKQKADFVISSVLVESEDIEAYELKEERLYLLVNATHPLAQQETVSIADMKEESFISVPAGYAFREMIDKMFLERGSHHNVVYECFPSQFVDLVEQNIGMAIVSGTSVAQGIYPLSLAVRAIEPPLSRSLYLLWDRSHTFSHAGRVFYNYVLEHKDAL